MKPEPTVFLVDDDDAVRDSLTLLCETAGFTVRAYASAEAFLADYQQDWAGCVVLDLRMPGMSGTDLQAELRNRQLTLPIIFLTAHGDIPTTVRAIKAGAIDFLTKPVEARPFLELLREAIALDQQRRTESRPMGELVLDRLTPRERDVISLILAGLTNKEIARQLGISHRTVENHRARIMDKTRAANLVQLALICQREGLTAAEVPLLTPPITPP